MTRAHSRAVVAMATHNSSRWVEEALRSVMDVCSRSRRECLLYVADDGSTDDTVQRVQRVLLLPQIPCAFRSFAKAPSVAEAKNRVYRLARPAVGPTDWLLWMDDDDVMLEGRMALLDLAEAAGASAAVGDYLHLHTGEQDCLTKEALWGGEFSPARTAVRGDVLPAGDYFTDVPVTVLEDLVTHRLMAERGVNWVHFPLPVLSYRSRPDGVSGMGTQRILKRDWTLSWLARQKGRPLSRTASA